MSAKYIARDQETKLQDWLSSDVYQVAVLYGARRIGKTTLVKKFLSKNKLEHLFVNGDDIQAQEVFSSQSAATLKNYIGKSRLLFIDEAQRIENIGYSLKILVDQISDLKIIATGSSSLDLGKNIGEPLGGRAKIIRVYPLAQHELQTIEDLIVTKSNLEARLIYGSYPIIVTHEDDQSRRDYLLETVESYLLKDILEFDGIRNSNKIKQLLRLIAFQIGKEVSIIELAGNLGLSKNTVVKYLDLLEKAFVIYSRQGFSRNLRSEVTRSYHYYFFDNGIRNALINNFNSLSFRDDLGMLWENYIVTERLKYNESRVHLPHSYFWRTYEQQEIDLIEEYAGQVHGFEIKYSRKPRKAPKQWTQAYPKASYTVINKDNYWGFVANA